VQISAAIAGRKKTNAANLPVLNQLLLIQLISSDASSKIPKMIV
jgi:hypothetical protein